MLEIVWSALCVCVFLPTAVLKIEPWHMQAALGQLLVLIAMETLAEPLGSGGIKQSEMDAVEGGHNGQYGRVLEKFMLDKLGRYSLTTRLCILVSFASYSQT